MSKTHGYPSLDRRMESLADGHCDKLKTDNQDHFMPGYKKLLSY